jgi:hypothetical protein
MGGYPIATAGNGGGLLYAPSVKSQLVILALDDVIYRMRNPIAKIYQLTLLDPREAVIESLRFAKGGDYSQALNHARELLLNRGQRLTISGEEIHRVIDAMADIHGSIHDAFSQVHRKPYRYIEFQRIIGDTGLVVKAYL